MQQMGADRAVELAEPRHRRNVMLVVLDAVRHRGRSGWPDSFRSQGSGRTASLWETKVGGDRTLSPRIQGRDRPRLRAVSNDGDRGRKGLPGQP
jgi:hypothetical protein